MDEQHPPVTENNRTDGSVVSNNSNTGIIHDKLMIDHDDPLLIAQSLTYITDNGSVVHTFSSAPFSFGFKIRFFLLELIFIFLLVAAVPINAHATAVSISIANMVVVAWFWYNSVRCVDVTSDGSLRFWIGNIEIEVPFEHITKMKRISISTPCSIVSYPLLPHRGLLSDPSDGVAVITSLSCTPFWAWPRSPLKAPRRCCCDTFGCPKQVIIFSPAGGSLNFMREVENEMRGGGGGGTHQMQQPPTFDPNSIGTNSNGTGRNDLLDV